MIYHSYNRAVRERLNLMKINAESFKLEEFDLIKANKMISSNDIVDDFENTMKCKEMKPTVEDESIRDRQEIYLNEKYKAEVEQFRIEMEENNYEYFDPLGKTYSINTTQDNVSNLPEHGNYKMMDSKVKITNIKEDIIFIQNKDNSIKEKK